MADPDGGVEREPGPIEALDEMAQGALLQFLKSVSETLKEAIERHGATEAARRAEDGGDRERSELSGS